jgi:hypothetical protein
MHFYIEEITLDLKQWRDISTVYIKVRILGDKLCS